MLPYLLAFPLNSLSFEFSLCPMMCACISVFRLADIFNALAEPCLAVVG